VPSDTFQKFLSIYRYIRRYARQVQGEGLSGRSISALRYLLDDGPLTIGQLRAYLYISDSSTSDLTDRLQDAGLVTRTRSAKDNRVVYVALTPAGKKVAEEVPLGGIPLLRERLKTLPPERHSLIQQGLAELIELLGIDDDR
jgi:DNA-binding MarR family transcriptional regulator